MKNNISTIFGERLLTITKVHGDTGISRSTLTDLYYRRSQRVQMDTLKRLCDYLQVPLHDLIDYEPVNITKA